MLKKIFKKIKKQKKLKKIAIVLSVIFIILPKKAGAIGGLLIGAGILATGLLASKEIGQALYAALTGVLYALIQVISMLTTVMIGFLTRIAAYNHFTDLKIIIEGWTIVRDVSNMFFIVFLMVIAISTIIQVESYNYKKMLPKLLIMAVLINFSKMFTGLLIDLSQVITLTFVDAFKNVGEGNLIKGLGIDKMYKFTSWDQSGDIFGTLVIMLIMMTIALIVVSALAITFLARVIAFWILIILSPFAYLLSASGGAGSKYADQWWSEFTKYLVVGPVLAFFLWLSLNMMSKQVTKEMEFNTTGLPGLSLSEAANPDNFAGYLISIAMLIGSLVAAQQIGAAGASVAGGALGMIKKGGMAPVGAAGWLGKKTGLWVGRKIDDTIGVQTSKGLGVGVMAYGGLGKLAGMAMRKKGGKWKKYADKKKLGSTFEAGKQLAAKGAQWRTLPKQWQESEARREMLQTTEGISTWGRAIDRYKTGDETYKHYQARGILDQETAKRFKDANLDLNTKATVKEALHGDDSERRTAIEFIAHNNDFDVLFNDYMATLDDDTKTKLGGVINPDTGNWETEMNDATVQYMLKDLVGTTDEDAQFVNKVGEIQRDNGNGEYWALSDLNTKTGKFEYAELTNKDGKVNPDGSILNENGMIKHAEKVAGKITTMDISQYNAKWHPDSEYNRIIINDPTTGKSIGQKRRETPGLVGAETGTVVYPTVSTSDTKRRARSDRKIAMIMGETDDQDIIDNNIDGAALGRRRQMLIDQGNSKQDADMAANAGLKKVNMVRATANRKAGKNIYAMITPADISSDLEAEKDVQWSMEDIDKTKRKATANKVEEYQKENKGNFYLSDEYKKGVESDKYYSKEAQEHADEVIDKKKKEDDRIKEKKKTTQDQIDEKGEEEFYNSDEYLKNKNQYYSQNQMQSLENKSKITGVNSAIRKGKQGKSASMLVDGADENWEDMIGDKAGVYLTGSKKDAAVKKMADAYKKQLEKENKQLADKDKKSDADIAAEIDELTNSLNQAKSLKLVNKASTVGARRGLRHEAMHDRIEDADQTKVKEAWDSMDNSKKDEIRTRVQSEWGNGEKMDDNEIMNEYFAEASANFGRKKTTVAGAMQMDAEQARILAGGGVKFKGTTAGVETVDGVAQRKKVAAVVQEEQYGEFEKSGLFGARAKIKAYKQKKTKKKEFDDQVDEIIKQDNEFKERKTQSDNSRKEMRTAQNTHEQKKQHAKETAKNVQYAKSDYENEKRKAAKLETEMLADAGNTTKRKAYDKQVDQVQASQKVVSNAKKANQSAQSEETTAKQSAQKAQRNYFSKDNAVQAANIDINKEDLAKLEAGGTTGEPVVMPDIVVKIDKHDYDQDIKALEQKLEQANKEEESAIVGSDGKTAKQHKIESITQDIEKAKKDKTEEDKKPDTKTVSGKIINVVQNNKDIAKSGENLETLYQDREQAKTPTARQKIQSDIDEEKQIIRTAKAQNADAINQRRQELDADKAKLNNNQQQTEKGRGATPPPKPASSMQEAKKAAQNKAKKDVENDPNVKPTDMAAAIKKAVESAAPGGYDPSGAPPQVVNNINNNIKNTISAAQAGTLGDQSGLLIRSLQNPMGRYWMTKIMGEAVSKLPADVAKLLSPQFANLVSDSEKAAQDKELDGKLKNYIGDIQIALGHGVERG